MPQPPPTPKHTRTQRLTTYTHTYTHMCAPTKVKLNCVRAHRVCVCEVHMRAGAGEIVGGLRARVCEWGPVRVCVCVHGKL